MNANNNSWSDIKEKIKTKWDKFSEKEIENFKDNLDDLTSKIQIVYGYAKDKAEKEYEDFKKSISNLVTSEKEMSHKEKPESKSA